MTEELCKVRHDAINDRIDKLEDLLTGLQKPEDGTLAKMRQSIKDDLTKLEAKLNWLFIFLFTTVTGAIVTIILSKLGFK